MNVEIQASKPARASRGGWNPARPARSIRHASSLIRLRYAPPGCSSPLEQELVAEPPHGLDVFGAAVIFLDLGPQPLDVDVERAGVTDILDSPHLGEQDL